MRESLPHRRGKDPRVGHEFQSEIPTQLPAHGRHESVRFKDELWDCSLWDTYRLECAVMGAAKRRKRVEKGKRKLVQKWQRKLQKAELKQRQLDSRRTQEYLMTASKKQAAAKGVSDLLDLGLFENGKKEAMHVSISKLHFARNSPAKAQSADGCELPFLDAMDAVDAEGGDFRVFATHSADATTSISSGSQKEAQSEAKAMAALSHASAERSDVTVSTEEVVTGSSSTSPLHLKNQALHSDSDNDKVEEKRDAADSRALADAKTTAFLLPRDSRNNHTRVKDAAAAMCAANGNNTSLVQRTLQRISEELMSHPLFVSTFYHSGLRVAKSALAGPLPVPDTVPSDYFPESFLAAVGDGSAAMRQLMQKIEQMDGGSLFGESADFVFRNTSAFLEQSATGGHSHKERLRECMRKHGGAILVNSALEGDSDEETEERREISKLLGTKHTLKPIVRKAVNCVDAYVLMDTSRHTFERRSKRLKEFRRVLRAQREGEDVNEIEELAGFRKRLRKSQSRLLLAASKAKADTSDSDAELCGDLALSKVSIATRSSSRLRRKKVRRFADDSNMSEDSSLEDSGRLQRRRRAPTRRNRDGGVLVESNSPACGWPPLSGGALSGRRRGHDSRDDEFEPPQASDGDSEDSENVETDSDSRNGSSEPKPRRSRRLRKRANGRRNQRRHRDAMAGGSLSHWTSTREGSAGGRRLRSSVSVSVSTGSQSEAESGIMEVANLYGFSEEPLVFGMLRSDRWLTDAHVDSQRDYIDRLVKDCGQTHVRRMGRRMEARFQMEYSLRKFLKQKRKAEENSSATASALRLRKGDLRSEALSRWRRGKRYRDPVSRAVSTQLMTRSFQTTAETIQEICNEFVPECVWRRYHLTCKRKNVPYRDYFSDSSESSSDQGSNHYLSLAETTDDDSFGGRIRHTKGRRKPGSGPLVDGNSDEDSPSLSYFSIHSTSSGELRHSATKYSSGGKRKRRRISGGRRVRQSPGGDQRVRKRPTVQMEDGVIRVGKDELSSRIFEAPQSPSRGGDAYALQPPFGTASMTGAAFGGAFTQPMMYQQMVYVDTNGNPVQMVPMSGSAMYNMLPMQTGFGTGTTQPIFTMDPTEACNFSEQLKGETGSDLIGGKVEDTETVATDTRRAAAQTEVVWSAAEKKNVELIVIDDDESDA